MRKRQRKKYLKKIGWWPNPQVFEIKADADATDIRIEAFDSLGRITNSPIDVRSFRIACSGDPAAETFQLTNFRMMTDE